MKTVDKPISSGVQNLDPSQRARALEAPRRDPQVVPQQVRLESPDLTRTPFAQTKSGTADIRAQSSQVETLRQQQALVPHSAKGKRQKNLRFENVEALSRPERKAFGDIRELLVQKQDQMARVRLASPEAYTELLRGVLEPLGPLLVTGLKAAKIRKADDTVHALRATDVDFFLVQTFFEGKLTKRSVDAERDRLEGLRSGGSVSADEIKTAIVAFDSIAQRLALSGGKATGFEYPTSENRARDLFTTWARAHYR